MAAGTRRVTRLELSLRERAATAELQRRDTEVSGDTGRGGTRGTYRDLLGTCWGQGNLLRTRGGHRGTRVGCMGTHWGHGNLLGTCWGHMGTRWGHAWGKGGRVWVHGDLLKIWGGHTWDVRGRAGDTGTC